MKSVLFGTTIFWSISLAQTETEALLNVFVLDFNGKPRVGDIVIFMDSVSKKQYKGITNDKGNFSLLLPKGKSYLVLLKSFEADTPQGKLFIPNHEGKVTFDYTIKYELPKVYRLEKIYFDFGKATLKPESYPALDNLVELLKIKKTMVIEVAGHTDSIGSEQKNLQLSQERANAIKNYLVKKGIGSDRIIAKGYGSSYPIATNSTEDGRQKNRRVEIKIISE